jgi:hypothetical protein
MRLFREIAFIYCDLTRSYSSAWDTSFQLSFSGDKNLVYRFLAHASYDVYQGVGLVTAETT